MVLKLQGFYLNPSHLIGPLKSGLDSELQSRGLLAQHTLTVLPSPVVRSGGGRGRDERETLTIFNRLYGTAAQAVHAYEPLKLRDQSQRWVKITMEVALPKYGSYVRNMSKLTSGFTRDTNSVLLGESLVSLDPSFHPDLLTTLTSLYTTSPFLAHDYLVYIKIDYIRIIVHYFS